MAINGTCQKQVSKEKLLRVCVEKPIWDLLPGFLHIFETGEPRNGALGMINNGSGLRKALWNGDHGRSWLAIERVPRSVDARVEVCEHIRCSGSEMADERYLGLDTSKTGSM